ncbi:MAG: hypothetical protein R3F59_29185 [Myxococcota bacterium]
MVRAAFTGPDEMSEDERRRWLETPWPAEVAGPVRRERASRGDLRCYTVGDWVMIVLRLYTAVTLATLLVAVIAAVGSAPLVFALQYL